MGGKVEIAEQQTAAILAALPATYSALAIITGTGYRAVVWRIERMRAAGQCHVGGWKRTTGKGGSFSPVFHAGPGEDVRCRLRAHTNAQYSEHFRARHKDTEIGMRRAAKNRARQWRIKAEQKGDQFALQAAFFGRAAA